MVGSALGMFAALASPVAAAECAPGTATSAELLTAIGDAEAAYEALDIEAFNAATDSIRGSLPCLGDPLTRSTAARVHRSEGLRAFVEADEGAARRAFAAARSVEPAYVLPTSLAPEGNPVRALYDDLPLSSGTSERLPEPAGRLTLDGVDTLERPLSWPTILQLFDEQGAVLATTYLTPEDAPPAYELLPEDVGQPDPRLQPGPSLSASWPPNPRILAVAGVAALGAGALYLGAVASHRDHQDPATPYEELDGLKARTNGLVVATWGAGATAVALGTGAFFVTRW